MSDQLHHFLDGELSDNEAVELLQSLISNEEHRMLFREQMKLHGALQRNESYDTLSAGEEAEMLARMSASIGIAPAPPTARGFGAKTWSMIVGALLIGSGLGYGGREAFTSERNGLDRAPIPAATIAPAPCNCDSVAALRVSAVRDSLGSTVRENAESTTRKPTVRSKRSRGISDPTGRDAARRLAEKKHRTHR